MPVWEAFISPIISMMTLCSSSLSAMCGSDGFIGVFGRGPVDAVHFGIVEAILHHAPCFLEDLPAFGRHGPPPCGP